MDLIETLRKHVGKHVVIRAIKGGQVLALSGTVHEQEDGLVLLQERQHIDEMIMTQQGPKKVDEIIPEAVHYLGNFGPDDVISVTVNTETEAEAKRQLESLIHKPSSGMLGKLAGR